MTDGEKILILYPSKRKLLITLTILLLFLMVGVSAINDGEWYGWPATIFVLIITFIAGVNILPGASYLKLDENGFELCSLYKKSFTEWKVVEKFAAGHVSTKKMVVLWYKPEYTSMQKARAVASALTDAEGAVAFEPKMTIEELAKLLNDWKLKYS